MGRLYEQIRKDIEKLRQIDEAINNDQLVNMDEVFATAIALQKIEYVITYAESENPGLLNEEGRFPLGDLQHFNIPENFEALVDGWEEALGEEKVNHALDHLRKQDEAEAYVPEITPHDPNGYYEYVHDTIDRIAHVSHKGHFGIDREGVIAMAVSAQQDLVKTIFAQDYAFDPNNKDNRPVLDFIDNPIEETVNAYVDPMMLETHQAQTDFIKERQKHYAELFRSSEHPRPFDEVNNNYPIAKALTPIRTAKWNPKELSEALCESVKKYATEYKGKKNEPSVGGFLSLARDRVESTLLDHAVVLGEDKDSKFLKDFLANPVQTMENHFRGPAAIDENDLQPGPNPVVADRIHGQEENYNQARVGKVDRFAQIEASKKRRFEENFFSQNLNFDPANFKRQYQGSTFERFLGRTSQEWTDLSNHIDSWKNIGEERDLDRAAELAERYLIHKFPGVDPKAVTPEMCRGLRGAGKDRGLFCLSLVQGKAMAEDQTNQEIYDEANRRFDVYEARLHRGQNFQDRLAGDIEKDNDIDKAHDDNEIVNENIINKDGLNV